MTCCTIACRFVKEGLDRFRCTQHAVVHLCTAKTPCELSEPSPFDQRPSCAISNRVWRFVPSFSVSAPLSLPGNQKRVRRCDQTVLDEISETVRELFGPAAKFSGQDLSQDIEAYVSELARLRPAYEQYGECAPRAFALGCLHHMEKGLGEAFPQDVLLQKLLPNASALESLTTLKRKHITTGMRFVREALSKARGNDTALRVLSFGVGKKPLPPSMRAHPHSDVMEKLKNAKMKRFSCLASRRTRSPSPLPIKYEPAGTM